MTVRRVGLLALAAFVVASDATLVAALLRQIATAVLAGPTPVGQAITAYAAGYAVGAPVIIRAARRVPQQRLLTGALGAFALANAATAAAPSLAVLLGARVVAGACGGSFMASASASAVGSAASHYQGRALAAIVAGSSAGTAFGVPLGTFAAAAVGWRSVFFGIAASAALMAAVLGCLPPQPQGRRSPARAGWPRGAALLTLATTLVWATGSFTFFTYVSVVLHQTALAGPRGVAGFLLVFGIAGLGGVATSGWLVDKSGVLRTVAAALALGACSLAGFGIIAGFAAGSVGIGGSIAAMAGYGFGTWAVTPPQQKRLLGGGVGRPRGDTLIGEDESARGGVRFSGGDSFLLALNASALYLGVGLGGAVAGVTLALGHSVATLCWLAAGIEVAALALVAQAASRNVRRSHRPAQPAVTENPGLGARES